MCLGNLFVRAGFDVLECRELVHRWPPARDAIADRLGWRAFHVSARIFGALSRRCSQVRIVAAPA
jgi:hypothetical protein